MSHLSKHFTVRYLALALLPAMLLAGCDIFGGGNSDSAASEPTPPAKAVPSTDTPIASTPPGISPEIEACLHSIPVYANSHEDLAARNDGGRVYLTEDPPGQIIAFYEASAPGSNCTKIVTRAGGADFTCKKDNLNVHVAVSAQPDRSQGSTILIECSPS